MSEIVKGMLQTYYSKCAPDIGEDGYTYDNNQEGMVVGMHAALLWLADHVTDEMVRALDWNIYSGAQIEDRKRAISAALRAAAEGK